MKKRFKKVVAIVSAIAMVLTSITYLPQAVNADTSLVGDATWQSWFAAGGSVTSTDASQEVVSGSIGDTWWNIQTWLPEVTFVKGYVYTGSFTVTANTPKQFRVDTRVGDKAVFDGDVTVSEWTQNGDGTYSCTYTGKSTEIAETNTFDLRISFGYFDGTNGATGGELEGWKAGDTLNATVSNFSLTREAVGEVDTDPEVTTPAGGYTKLQSADTQVGPWILYSANNSWVAGEMQYKGGTSDSDLSCKVIKSSGNPGCWGMQVKYPLSGLEAGKEYKYTVKYTTSNAGKMFLKLEGVNDGATTDAAAGENTMTGTFTAGAAAITMVFELSGFAADTVIDFNGITVAENTQEPDTTATVEPDTTATVEPDTTVSTGEADWVEIGGSDGTASYYYDKASMTVNAVVNIQKPAWAAENGIYMNVTSGISEVSVNGVTENVATIDGAGAVVFLSALTKEVNEVVIKHALGTATVSVKKVGGTEEQTTVETPTEEQTTVETPTEEQTTVETPTEEQTTAPSGEADWVEIGGSDGTASYYYDKANMTVNAVVNIQQPAWAAENGIYMNVPAGISEVSVNGVTENVATIDGAGAVVFLSALTQEVNEVVIKHGLGTATVSIKKVAAEPAQTYTVTVDGNKVAEVEEGQTYTLGDAKYGYYADGQMYKAGTALTITGDVTLTSVNELAVTMAGGAAIKTSTPAGLKFQATVNSNNADAVKSDAIKEGMLITANDIFENNNSVLDLTSAYTKLNIENSGWANADTMTYCGAVANIVEQNYVRGFIARAYVTVSYTDGTSTTIYSDMGSVRSVNEVASAVKNDGYKGLNATEISVIDSFIK